MLDSSFRYVVLSLLLLLSLRPVYAQAPSGKTISDFKTGESVFSAPMNFTGLWEVERVKVGDEERTPTARWFRLYENGTSEGGNGWIQNSLGSWQFDEEKQTILFIEGETVDPYGAFYLRVENDRMSWSRTEDGLNVNVSLVRVNKKPLGPWDKIVGFWEMEESDEQIFFRWDRRYIWRKNGQVVARGLWQIAAHSPTLSLVPDKGNRRQWQLRFSEKAMQWEGEVDGKRLTKKLRQME